MLINKFKIVEHFSTGFLLAFYPQIHGTFGPVSADFESGI